MDGFFTWDFPVLLVLIIALFLIHELGHYLAYRVLGYRAVIRKVVFVPGIDPKETIEVTRSEGLVISMSGFILTVMLVVLPCVLVGYKQCFALFMASIAGSFMDLFWVMNLLYRKRITIAPRH